MSKTHLKKISEKHNCSNDIHVCRVHMHENKKKKNELLRNLLHDLLRNPALALHQSLSDLLRNLLRKPVEPDLALPQSLPHLLRNLLRNPVEPGLPGTFSGNFSGTLLNKPPRHYPEPSPEACWTWLGSAPKPPRPSLEPSPEPCWTWPGSAPKPPRHYPEPSPEPCWTWPGSAPKPPPPSPEPSPEPC